MADQHERDSHQLARERFQEYATGVALGRSPAREYPDVAAHLADCDQCRSDLAELLDLIVPPYTGPAAPSPADARPDLAFLPARRPPAARPPWRTDELGRLVIALGDALAAILLPGRTTHAPAARGTLLHTFIAADAPSPALRATVEIWQDDPDQPLGRLRVSVDRLDGDPFAQGGVVVALAAAEGEQRATTDALGHAEFPALPLDTLAGRTIIIGP